MTCHYFRLVCPAGILFSHNRAATAAWAGGNIAQLRNCKENPAVSINSYALRNWVTAAFAFFWTT